MKASYFNHNPDSATVGWIRIGGADELIETVRCSLSTLMSRRFSKIEVTSKLLVMGWPESPHRRNLITPT